VNIREWFKEEEGNGLPGKPFEAYRCRSGALTIGYGHNIDANGLRITEEFAEELLTEDIDNAARQAALIFDNFVDLDPVRRAVLVGMVFQMGAESVRGFKKTIAYIETEMFAEAAAQMRRSQWYTQTPKRAERCARMMETGEW
jgi:lysozyme